MAPDLNKMLKWEDQELGNLSDYGSDKKNKKDEETRKLQKRVNDHSTNSTTKFWKIEINVMLLVSKKVISTDMLLQ